jgi:hypothetical protein
MRQITNGNSYIGTNKCAPTYKGYTYNGVSYSHPAEAAFHEAIEAPRDPLWKSMLTILLMLPVLLWIFLVPMWICGNFTHDGFLMFVSVLLWWGLHILAYKVYWKIRPATTP